ncbi:MAG: 50S ribosomal protein L10 [Planctomycetales bacterium]
MSKYVKNLISQELSHRLDGVEDALLVTVVGLNANSTMTLRRELRSKDIQLMVVKNSLAHRATKDTMLAPAFESAKGALAVVWGSEDVVSLAKEVVRLSKEEQYEGFQPRCGVMDGSLLTSEQVDQVSKWPSRTEQLSILSGQLLSPGATLSAQLIGPGGALVSQFNQISEGEDQTD